MPAERSRGESRERENNPDQAATAVMDEVVSNREIKDATSSEPAPEAVSKAKNFLKNPAVQGSVFVSGFGIKTVFKMAWNMLRLAKEAVIDRNMNYKRGKELGEEPLLFDGKKDKKS